MRGTPVRQVDFRGGLNTKAAPLLVGPTECRDCLNVVTTVRGSIKRRPGNITFTTGFAAAASSITSLYALQNVPTAGNILLAVDNLGQAYKIDSSKLSTGISGPGAFDSRVSVIQAPANGGQGPIYFSDSVNANYWAGSGPISAWTATSGTVPTGKYMVYFKNRVWVAGQTANPSRLFFSDIGNPRAWPTANVVDFDPTDGEDITGLGIAGPYLVVFKSNKAWVVYDLDTGANRPLSTAIGSPAHRSIVETPSWTYFLTMDKGIYRTNGKKLEQISDKITPTLLSIVDAQRMNACGGYFNDKYFLSFCVSGSTNNTTLEYDIPTSSWWRHSNFANQFALWRPVDEAQLYTARPDTRQVDQAYVDTALTDNNSNFQCLWKGPWLAFNEPYRNKRLRQIHVDGNGTVDAYIARDYKQNLDLVKTNIFSYTGAVGVFGGAGTFGVDGVFGDVADTLFARLYTLGVGRAFSFEIQATSGNVFEMDSYTPYITLRQN